jgi:hypothetical protein
MSDAAWVARRRRRAGGRAARLRWSRKTSFSLAMPLRQRPPRVLFFPRALASLRDQLGELRSRPFDRGDAHIGRNTAFRTRPSGRSFGICELRRHSTAPFDFRPRLASHRGWPVISGPRSRQAPGDRFLHSPICTSARGASRLAPTNKADPKDFGSARVARLVTLYLCRRVATCRRQPPSWTQAGP